MERIDIDMLTERYIRGKLSDEEVAYLAEWTRSSAENMSCFRRKVAEMEQQIAEHAVADDPEWMVLRQKLRMGGQQKKKFALAVFVRVAAAVVLLLSLSIGGYFYYNPADDLVVVRVLNGQIDTVLLPDNSRVILNSGSVLKYAESFGKDNRALELQGEGFFEVTKNEKQRFVVKLGETEAVVYGTSFNANYYPGSECVAVTLCTGSLKLQAKDTGVFITPGQQVMYNLAGRDVSVKEVDTSVFCCWFNGLTVLSSEKLSSILPRLERKFDVKIVLESPELADYSFSGQFAGDVSLDYILNIIRESSPVPLLIQKQDNVFRISLSSQK